MNLKVLAAALILAGFIGAYTAGRWDGSRIKEGQQAMAKLAAEETARVSREAAAVAISKISVKHQTIHNALEREVIREPIYTRTDCRLTPDGLRLVNQAITGSQPGAGVVPTVGPSQE